MNPSARDVRSAPAASAAPAAPAAQVGDDAALAELVARARGGDHAAFSALFQRFNARIRTYLAQLVGDDDVGRDLAQDTFLAAWRALPAIHDPARFSPWLYRIATNIARSHQRHAMLVRWLPWAEHAEGVAQERLRVAGPEQHAGEHERVALALRRLAPQQRTCLLLQLEGGFTQREIAELLGIGEKSVSAYVSRAREEFRRAYDELEGEPGQSTPSAGKGGGAR